MRVVIRFGKGSRIAHKAPQKQPAFALAVSALLTPAAVAAAVLGLWRIAADLRLAADFAISSGFFSHWQVWIAAAVLLEIVAHLLGRSAHKPPAPEPANSPEPVKRPDRGF